MRLKMISVLFIFAITAAGVVSCGGPKIPPRTFIQSADYIFLLVLCDQRGYSEKSGTNFRFRFSVS